MHYDRIRSGGACNNCGLTGHVSSKCKNPITSYGIILVDQYHRMLMIRRKDTYGYVDYVRGRYSLADNDQLCILIDEMTCDEKAHIKSIKTADDITQTWRKLWGHKTASAGRRYRHEESHAHKVMKRSVNAYMGSSNQLDIKRSNNKISQLCNESKTRWVEPEWGFPKGKQDSSDVDDLMTAKREFTEETGFDIDTIQIVANIKPIEEVYIGSDNRIYKHKYYLAFDQHEDRCLDNYQQTEVSKLEWKSFQEAIDTQRDPSNSKVNVVRLVEEIVEKTGGIPPNPPSRAMMESPRAMMESPRAMMESPRVMLECNHALQITAGHVGM
jgi:ADP-ribose pyrophosphatase YjhB (NUDIX family)